MLDQQALDVELQLLTRSDLHSDDKWFVEQYKVYLNLVWLNGTIGTGAGDVAGGADYRPTDAAMEELAGIGKGPRRGEGGLRCLHDEGPRGVQHLDGGAVTPDHGNTPNPAHSCQDPAMTRSHTIRLLAIAMWAASGTLSAQATSSPTVDPRLYAGLTWRNVGPFRGGRVGAVTGVMGEPGTFYAGFPGGGVWKTTSAGEDVVPGVRRDQGSVVGGSGGGGAVGREHHLCRHR